ncbi:hypothetical protein M432DRAFT_94323 [Thermoascus aurantiacus ATCC 26904]
MLSVSCSIIGFLLMSLSNYVYYLGLSRIPLPTNSGYHPVPSLAADSQADHFLIRPPGKYTSKPIVGPASANIGTWTICLSPAVSKHWPSRKVKVHAFYLIFIPTKYWL